jgi:hypothetical protein
MQVHILFLLIRGIPPGVHSPLNQTAHMENTMIPMRKTSRNITSLSGIR